MYDIGINPETGKRRLVAKRPNNNALYTYNEVLVPCGKCPACIESRRFDWNLRLQFELKTFPSATFITLTYNPEHLPFGNKASKADVQAFLKRLRNCNRDFGVPVYHNLRYYIASEHGDKLGRVHYHGIIYGINCFDAPWKTYVHHLDENGYPVYVSPILEKIWNKGFITVCSVTPKSIAYISDYIYGGCYDDDIRLYSIGLGVGFYCNYAKNSRNRLVPSSLKKSAVQAAKFGFSTIGPLDKIRKVPPPRFLKRYLEKFDPELYEIYTEMRKNYALEKSASAPLPHLVVEHLQTKQQQRKVKSKL